MHLTNDDYVRGAGALSTSGDPITSYSRPNELEYTLASVSVPYDVCLSIYDPIYVVVII